MLCSSSESCDIRISRHLVHIFPLPACVLRRYAVGPEEATLHLTAISDLLTLTNESSQELFVYLQRTAQCICWALHAVFAYTRDLHQRPTPETYTRDLHQGLTFTAHLSSTALAACSPSRFSISGCRRNLSDWL